MRNRQIKQLNRAYKKHFTIINKQFLCEKTTCAALFVEYLRYIRDKLIVETPGHLNEFSYDNINITALMTAIAEYEAWELDKQKKTHLDNFCELTKQYMWDWLKLNDSV